MNRRILELLVVLAIIAVGIFSMRKRIEPLNERPLVIEVQLPDAPNQLFLQTPSGQPTQVTDGTHICSEPSLSPDGKWIAYLKVDPKGDEEYCLIGSDGQGFRKLIRTEGVRKASWSPDSRQMALEITKEASTSVVIVDLSGKVIRRLTDPDGPSEASPAWSPDGRSLALERSGNIVIVDPQTGKDKWSLGGVQCRSPQWSPDSQSLLFATEKRDGYELVTVKLADKSKKIVDGYTATLGYEDPPTWSPDGKSILLWSRRGQGATVYLAEAGKVKSLLPKDALGWKPCWSGDGKKIAYIAENEHVHLMNRDGSGDRELFTRGNARSLSW